jgi:hypothetical protein
MRKVQRLNNDVFNPRANEPAESLTWWNRGFNMVAQHHKISSKTWGVNMPYEILKRALLGDEIAALSTLRNNAPEIDTRVKEAQGDEAKGLEMAGMIEAGLRKTTLGGEARIPFNEIGDFSTIISVMHPDAASKILRQDLCWYLWAKHNKTPEWRKAFATQQGYPDDPITLPATQGETDIYNKCKKQIDRIIEQNQAAGAEKRITPGKAAVAPGSGKVAGGLGTPAPKPAAAPGVPAENYVYPEPFRSVPKKSSKWEIGVTELQN